MAIEKQEPDVLPLVQRAVAGDREAFDELVYLYRESVYSSCWHLTRNAEDAADVTQEVFIRVYRALSSFKGNARFTTWLHRVVLNTCLDHIRREKKHRKNVSSDELEQEEGRTRDLPGSTVQAGQRQHIYHQQLQARVLLALGELSGRQREVFLLRYYQELELRQIAETLRCSEGSVKRHLHRAQQRLREILKDIRPA